jgi:paraquat-inducible protein A
VKPSPITALNASLISCHSCHLLCKAAPAAKAFAVSCPRCGARLHSRKPNSIARTWALVIAAFIFYIPANVLPITNVISFGKAQADIRQLAHCAGDFCGQCFRPVAEAFSALLFIDFGPA